VTGVLKVAIYGSFRSPVQGSRAHTEESFWHFKIPTLLLVFL